MLQQARFCTGSPCYRCGGTKRYTNHRSCVACQLARNREASRSGIQAALSRAYYQRNAKLVKKRVAKWKAKNADKVNQSNAYRRAAKLNCTPKWLTPEQKALMAAMYTEAARRTRETGVMWQVDHIVPLKGRNVCGLHIPENLQLLTAAENARKGNRFLAEAAD